MRRFIHYAAFAAIVGVFPSDGWAQRPKRPPAEAAGWRSPIPRTELKDKFKGGELNAVEFLNHNVGWAVGGGSYAKATMIFRTDDGGKTWERQTTFDGETRNPKFTDIGFADANNGWIVGTHHILRTTDGGESWEPVNTKPAFDSPWATKALVLGPDAIIVGSGVQNRQIMRSFDGGATWDISADLQAGSVDGAHPNVSGLAFAEPSTLFATTGTQHGKRGIIWRSDDAGKTWEIAAEADKPLLGIAFHGNRGVAVGANVAFWTADGGDTWKRVVIPGIQFDVDFIDENTVVATGSAQVVISRNGGKTWQNFPAPLEHGHLVDVETIDAGFWFVAGGYGANALFQYVDPNHTEPIAEAEILIPFDIELGDKKLPRGVYDVTLGHRGDEHVIEVDRESEMPRDADVPEELEKAAKEQEDQKPPACSEPCEVTLPVEVTYEKEEVPPEAAGESSGGDKAAGAVAALKNFFRIRLEPTASGIALVVQTAVTPPRNLALALAAVGAPQTAEGEARDVAKQARKDGGLLNRVKKAASGDVKGAVAGSGVNPQAASQRFKAAKSAPPAVYKITLRHTLNLFGSKETKSNN